MEREEANATGFGAPAAASPDRSSVRIERVFAAPRALVWRAWTLPDAVVRWLGPVDWPAVCFKADLRPGGNWRACLRSPSSGEELWQSGRYLVIEPPERLSFTFRWEGDNHEDGPGIDTVVTVHLETLPDGGTRMRFTHAGLVSDDSARGHTGGWQSTFDRLTQLLAEEDQ